MRSWCNVYRPRKWTWRPELKYWTRLNAFHIGKGMHVLEKLTFFASVFFRDWVHKYIRYVYSHLQMHIHTYMLCLYTYTYIYIYIYIYSSPHTHTRTHTHTHIYMLIYMVGWLGFYGISTFEDYLTPNPFLCK